MLTPKRPRIVLNYTEREWIEINDGVKKSGKNHVLQYIISETKNLESSFLNFHPIENNKLVPAKKEFYLPEGTYEILQALADKLKIHPNKIVARLMINPLLKK